MQQPLHKNDPTHSSKSLSISRAGKQKLSKSQEAFNKLTQKIERLQKDIEKKHLQFDLALKIYGTELYPAQLKLLAARRQLIIVLWDIYQSNKLSKPNQRHLKNVLQFHLQEYFEQTETEPDEVIQAIFSAIEGISYEKMMEEEKEQHLAQMKEMFEQVNVDMQDVDMKDEAAMAAKIAEANQKIKEIEERNKEREKKRQERKKKSKKEVEHEKMQKAVAEMKQKNISTIYKQLAKLFHPDLEQDAGRKLEKEILMKELTTAYEAKNLHALLTLELRWIHKENDHLESLTDEKLSIYLQILKEQANELEQTKHRIFQQPQYAVLVHQFGYKLQRDPVASVKIELTNAQSVAGEFEKDIAAFQSDTALRHINEMLKQWKKNEHEFDEEAAIMKMLFG